jgi:multiple sugar transport system ATP-binding protein
MKQLLDRKPGALSGGQRQRVALGRAIVREPKVFLLDEPLSNLDAVLRAQMRTELVRIHRSLGRTMIYVTHDQTEAMTMGDIIAVMDGGRIQQIGSPLEVYNRPATKFVAGFIGSPPMNIWPVTAVDGGRLLAENNQELDLPPQSREALSDYAGRNILVGVRPHDLVPSVKRPEGPSLQGIVELSEYTGGDVFLRVSCSSGEMIAKASEGFGTDPGDSVYIPLSGASLHLFDAESGRRLN